MTDKKSDQKQRGYVVLTGGDRVNTTGRLEDEASRLLTEARRNLEDGLYPESVAASRLAMEKCAKGILLASLGKYPRAHRFKAEDTTAALRQIRSMCGPVMSRAVVPACARAMLMSNRWSSSYIDVTHGKQEAGLSPKDLFDSVEAQRAVEDALRCKNALNMLRLSAKKPGSIGVV